MLTLKSLWQFVLTSICAPFKNLLSWTFGPHSVICPLPVALTGSVGMLPCRMWSQRGLQDPVNPLQHTVRRLYQVGFPQLLTYLSVQTRNEVWQKSSISCYNFWRLTLSGDFVASYCQFIYDFSGSSIHLAMDVVRHKHNTFILNEMQDCLYLLLVLCHWALLHLVCDILSNRMRIAFD